jgi:hypothetical protein
MIMKRVDKLNVLIDGRPVGTLALKTGLLNSRTDRMIQTSAKWNTTTPNVLNAVVFT